MLVSKWSKTGSKEPKGGGVAADPQPPEWRPPASQIPRLPGVYRFQDEQGQVIYVGKAKNLRNRLTSYFEDPLTLHPRTAMMVQTAKSVQWTVVNSEVEALTLEFQWIKEFSPRFNVMFRDDKSYPYLAVTVGEEIPRVSISREAKRKDVKYFGPYTHVWALRETMDVLLRAFPVRTCSAGVLRTAKAQGRPCLRGYIEKCSAPCVGRVSVGEHRLLVEQLCEFMAGNSEAIVAQTEIAMRRAVSKLNFELAARKRDELAAMQKVLEQNGIVLQTDTNADVYALVSDELDAAVYVFYVRAGRVRGGRGWGIDRADERTEAQLMADFLQQEYASRNLDSKPKRRAGKVAPSSVDDVSHLEVNQIPLHIFVSPLPEDAPVLENWLAELRGRTVHLSEPKRGEKAELIERVKANAGQTLQLHKTHKLTDLTERGQALAQLGEELDLDRAPLRIECYDISHTQGTNRVASMVVFEDGLPRKDAYRTFTIRGEGDKQDDTAAMAEVLARRFKRLQQEERDAGEEPAASGLIDPDTGKPRRFSYRPDLVVVDGGAPQVSAAAQTLAELGVEVPVIGLAKRLEQVWLPDDDFPVILPRTSAALYLLQHLRDESHRYANRTHRQRRTKSMTRSELDQVPGLGAARQKALLTHFGSLKRIKAATVEELTKVPGFGKKRAEALFLHLHPEAAPAD